MSGMTKMPNDVDALIGRLERKYPAEIDAFLNFIKSAEGGPALSAPARKN